MTLALTPLMGSVLYVIFVEAAASLVVVPASLGTAEKARAAAPSVATPASAILCCFVSLFSLVRRL